MNTERTNLEDMSKDALIELIMELTSEADHREIDLSGTNDALAMEGDQADHWAGIARQLDKVVIYYQAYCARLPHEQALEHAGLTNDQLGDAVQALAEREAARLAEVKRRADRAAKKSEK